MNDKISACMEMCRVLYNLNISIVDRDEDITAFADEYRLIEGQKICDEKILKSAVSSVKDNELCLITDIFLMSVLILRAGDSHMIVGPYTSVLLSQAGAYTVIKTSNIQWLPVRDLLSYRSSFPVKEHDEIINIVRTILQICCPDEPSKRLTSAEYEGQAIQAKNSSETLEKGYLDTLIKRYDFEKSFLASIRSGNARAAILSLHNMQMNVSFMKRTDISASQSQLGTTIEIERIAAAVTRTSVRIAALEAGLPPLIVDGLSQENTLATRQAATIDEILSAKEEMINDFCRAINELHTGSYSYLVQSAIYFMQHEYYRKISFAELAEYLSVSENYLLRIFKKETGTTPGKYLTSLRMEKAAMLLQNSSYLVGEVASMVGINDTNYFIRVFKKQYGKSPMQYRKSI